MDYKARRYFLVAFNDSMSAWWVKTHDDYGEEYNASLRMLRGKFSNVKISPPHNHITNQISTEEAKYEYQMMLSCPIAESEKLIGFLNDRKVNSKYCKWIELTREFCGQ